MLRKLGLVWLLSVFFACSSGKNTVDEHSLPNLVSAFKASKSCAGLETLAYYDISNTFNRPLIANKRAFLDSINQKLSFDEQLAHSSFYWYSDCCNRFDFQLINHFNEDLEISFYQKNKALTSALSDYLDIELLSDNTEHNIYGVLHLRYKNEEIFDISL